MKKNIVILSGGNSEEADISRVSSKEIFKALNSEKYEKFVLDPKNFDSLAKMVLKIAQINPLIVFNGLHGAEGEDGRIQSLFSLENIPFTGSNQHSSAIAMDKYLSGILAKSIGIPVPKRIILNKKNWKLPKNLSFPIIVKPNNSGSSVGISLVKNEIELEKAIIISFKYSDIVIVEDFIDGRELTVTILGEKALPVVEIKPKDGWYDYNNKYTNGNTIYEVPAKLNKLELATIQSFAKNIFSLIGCSVYGRVDFRYDENKFYFLEINTLPGMTPLSLTPMAAKEAGYNFEDLIEKIIEISLNNFEGLL